MKESFLFLAEGFEEIEALTAVDVLRRAGIPVKTVSITSSLLVTGAHGVTVKADVIWNSALFKDPAWLILPGGMPGAQNLYEFAPLQGLLAAQYESPDGCIAAICAAPAVVLGQLGLLKGHHATCYPGFEDMLQGAIIENSPVVRDRKFVLGNGPSNALIWALAIVGKALERRAADKVATDMLLYNPDRGSIENFFG